MEPRSGMALTQSPLTSWDEPGTIKSVALLGDENRPFSTLQEKTAAFPSYPLTKYEGRAFWCGYVGGDAEAKRTRDRSSMMMISKTWFDMALEF